MIDEYAHVWADYARLPFGRSWLSTLISIIHGDRSQGDGRSRSWVCDIEFGHGEGHGDGRGDGRGPGYGDGYGWGNGDGYGQGNDKYPGDGDGDGDGALDDAGVGYGDSIGYGDAVDLDTL